MPDKETHLFWPIETNLEDSIKSLETSPLRLSLDTLVFDVDHKRYVDEEIDEFLHSLRVMGLIEQRRLQKQGYQKIFLKRPAYYRMVEEERERLGSWGKTRGIPRYSVCVCNYNMGDTLERAMNSVANQLDPSLYEILVIDDGSNDKSLQVLDDLAKKHPHFRYMSLPRDRNRRLGETRNLSIRAARGEYVLIHIDADDEWEPYLPDVVHLFHNLEAAVGHDFLLAGQQTGIAKRDFLLAYGPYQNIYRCEDRNMMMKLAKRNLLLFMDYRVYRTRLERPAPKKIIKILRDTCSNMLFEFRQNEKEPGHVLRTLLGPFKKNREFSFLARLLRAILVLPIYGLSFFYPPVINDMTWEELRRYHEKHRGTYTEIMKRFGKDPDLSFLTPAAREIFTYDIRGPGFQSMR